ncbi:MAG: hypothetical protein R6V44_14595 [Paracoccaceae bacterium]
MDLVLERESRPEGQYEEIPAFPMDPPAPRIPQGLNSSYFRNADVVLVTTAISSLFLVIGAAEPRAARVRLP